MSLPHRGGRGARSRARCIGVVIAGEERIAPRKSEGLQLPRGSCEGAAEVILGMGMSARKSRTTAAQDGCDLWSGCATTKQFLGDPLIRDAPVGLRKMFQNPQPVQPTGIDVGRGRRCCCASRVAMAGHRRRKTWGQRQVRVAGKTAFGRCEQRGASGCPAGVGVQHLHPRSVTTPVAPLRLLIGESGQAAQMTPVGAGPIAAVGLGQVFADITGNGGLYGRSTN